MIKRWVPNWVYPLILAIAVGTVWLRLTIVNTTYTIGQYDQRIRNMTREREQAELKLAGLRSPRRLEQIARNKFNLSQPRSDQVVYIK